MNTAGNAVQCFTCGNWHNVGPCPTGLWPPDFKLGHVRVDVQDEILEELRAIRKLLEKRP